MEKLEEKVSDTQPIYETNEPLEISRVLDRYGIPFFYRQPTIVLNPESGNNEIWKPSFTLPQYGCSVIDYIKNASDINHIKDIYRYNQIPAVVLGPKELTEPNFQQNLYEKIQRELIHPHREYVSMKK